MIKNYKWLLMMVGVIAFLPLTVGAHADSPEQEMDARIGPANSICFMPPHPLKKDRDQFQPIDGVSGRYGMQPHSHDASARSQTPVTGVIKVLAIRVEFQEEIPDDPLTSGNGLMNLTGDPPEAYWQDVNENGELNAVPYPHDRAYFDRYMKAMHNYYWAISDQQLFVDWDVAPFNDTLSYRLENPRAYYGLFGGSGYEDIGPGLVAFMHDAIVAADADPDYLMSDYDAYILFHSGPGREVDINGDTPGDLWSAFIPLPDLRDVLANNDPDYRGIPVDDSTHFVEEASIVPESNNTDGYYIGLQGSLFHEFGHQLGLPDLYDTSGYSIGVASWDLMASGGNNDNGYFPAEFSVWSKYYLGWVEPEVITENGTYTIHAIEANGASTPRAYKIPINSHEYYLIENRQFSLNNNASCPNCPAPSAEEDNFSARLLNPASGDTMSFFSEKSTIVWASDHDFFLQGEGLLIWHIDDEIIEGNFFTNTVNYSVPKGVDLEEADGINDDLDPAFLYAAYYGSPYDVFYEGNNNAFTPFTMPSSHTNNGSDTHIFITDISESGIEMSFTVEFDWTQNGFPQQFGEQLATNSPNVGDIDGDGQPEIVATSATGNIFAFNHDGTPVISTASNGLLESMGHTSQASTALHDLDGDGDMEIISTSNDGKLYAWHGNADNSTRLVDGFPVQVEGKLSSPVVWDLYQNGNVYIFAASNTGLLHGWRVTQGELIEAPGFPIYCENGLVGDPLLVDLTGENEIDFIAIASQAGKIFAFEPNGVAVSGFPVNLEQSISTSMIAGDIDRNFWKEIIVGTESGHVYALRHNGAIVEGFPRQVSGQIHATPALGDLDSDGYPEIIVPNGNYHVGVINSNGILMAEWPNEFDQYTNHPVEYLSASPIVADVDDDNDLEVLLATWDQNIHAWHHDGTPVDRFPLSLGGDVGSTPLVANMDSDPFLELVAASEDGFFYAWELPSQSNMVAWPQYRHNPSLTGQLSNDNLSNITYENGILIEESVYVYPNPAKDSNPKFRYRIGQPAGVWINIYDVSGDLVAELDGTNYLGIDNEVEWDVTDIASGIYFAQVYAQSGLDKAHKTVKVAVTK